jgi:hypothetical protein
MIEWKYEKYLWFSVRAKYRKMLSAKNISNKKTSLKPFYDGNHFTSKQTEHKSYQNSENTIFFNKKIKINIFKDSSMDFFCKFR